MTSEEEQVLSKLQEWAGQQGRLAGFLGLYYDLLSAQLEARARVSIAGLPSPSVVARRLQDGVPCLSFEEIAWDEALFQELFRQVAGILEKHQVASGDVSKALIEASEGPAFLRKAARSLYERGAGPEEAAVASPPLLQTAVQASLWPFLSRYWQALSPLVKQESWLRGTCPVCGGRPDLGFLEKEAGARWLMCSRCDARWLFRRIGCPYCGTEDQDRLSYLVSEDGLYRLYLCEGCRSYLKVVDLRKTSTEVLLSLERVLTLDMDRQAQEKGYEAGWARARP